MHHASLINDLFLYLTQIRGRSVGCLLTFKSLIQWPQKHQKIDENCLNEETTFPEIEYLQ